MDYSVKFKKACEEVNLDDMDYWHGCWNKDQAQRDPNFDANFLFASAIVYAIVFILNHDSQYYEKMIAFYRSAKMTYLYKPENPSLYDWYESKADAVVSKAENMK